MKKNQQASFDRAVKELKPEDREEAHKANEALSTDNTKGLVRLEEYANSDLNLQGWKLTAVLDDILMCQYVDVSEDGKQIRRGSIWIPVGVVQHAWRVGKVLLAGPRAKVKPGQHVIFPSTFGLKASNINNLKNICFLNEDRVFGVAEPENETIPNSVSSTSK